MLDISYIREHKDDVIRFAKDKQQPVDDFIDRLLELDANRGELIRQGDAKRSERKQLSASMGGGKPAADVLERAQVLKGEIQHIEQELREVETELVSLMEKVPNIPSEDTPIGKDDSENVVLRTVGDVPTFSFIPKPHDELGKKLGIVDSERAGEVSGSRFTYLMGKLVQVEFALVQYVLSVLTDEKKLAAIIKEKGLKVTPTPFIPVVPPVLVKAEVLQKMARLEPKDERYHIPQDDLYLVGSAEHTLGPLHMNEVMAEKDLPRRYVGFSTSFRREAGSYGKDTKGILRLHQFDKVEMETFTLPEQSIAEQDFLVAIQEYIVSQLGIPYRVVMCCTGDMGGPDARHLDIECWMPGQNTYRETHSADLMTDYQARRLKTRVKRADGTIQYVHMNDATAIAVGRTLIALIENFQREDGSIAIPDVLHSYLSFTEISAS